MNNSQLIEQIAYAIVKALLDWLEKRQNTMQNAGKPLPADAVAFRERLNKFLQNTSSNSGQK